MSKRMWVNPAHSCFFTDYFNYLSEIIRSHSSFSSRKNITLESFVYIKNRKIIPFFKPVLLGPLRINVDDKKVSKAEFYVNGKLKETVAEAPYVWTWNEPAFMKQNIETKIYDQNENDNSSGEMTFYMFNPTRPRK